MNQVRVIPLWLGGGFGGKVKSHLEPICALLARATDRPVRIVLTREEEFINAKARPPYRIRLKTGVKNDGTLVAREADILVDSGGYTDHALGTAAHALSCVQSTYRIPNLKARSRSVYTNNPDWGCMRGYGTIQALFAAEAQMDVIARALKMDPAELRLKNLLQDGDTWITGEKVRGVQVRATMEAALEASGYWEKKGRLPAHQGIGIANLVKSCGLLSSAASIKANEDGTLSVISAVQDIGTGSHTVLCQIAAETLGLPLERVRIAAGDSDSAPYDTGSIASRTTFDAGNAVRLAAEDLRHNLKRVAAKAFNCSLDEVLYEDGRAFCRGREDQGMHFEALVGASIYAFHGPVMGHGAWMGAPPFAEQPGEGYPEGPYPTYAYGTHVVEVEVDPDTGKIKILDLTACHDVGRVLLPAGIQGQVEGGVVQGIGYGLFEELLLEQGAVQNPNLVDYKIATALDVPRVKMSFIEIPDAKGPFGAKGIGEHPILGPAPALLNAVLDATGVAFHRIPLTVERMYFALQDRRDEAGDGQEKKDP
jgi:CO/xanthine dehydrogenase Mo-binding subunit